MLRVDARRDGHRGCRDRLVGSSDGHAHALVLDLDLADARLLHDLHELADALPALGVGVLGDEHRIARVARADDLEQLLGVRAEHGDEDELLLARGEALGLLAHVLRGHRVLGELCRGASASSTARSTVGSIGSGVMPYPPWTSSRNSSITDP